MVVIKICHKFSDTPPFKTWSLIPTPVGYRLDLRDFLLTNSMRQWCGALRETNYHHVVRTLKQSAGELRTADCQH